MKQELETDGARRETARRLALLLLRRSLADTRVAAGKFVAKLPLTDPARVGLVTAFPFTTRRFTSVLMAIEIKIRKNEPIDRALGFREIYEDFSSGARSIRFSQKIGRNDPCTCGSGKKYKKCHGS